MKISHMILGVLCVGLMSFGLYHLRTVVAPSNLSANVSIEFPLETPSTATTSSTVSDHLSPPISAARSRITKKPFALYVSRQKSPVSPEKFQGYHTGVDFETTVDEADEDVMISAVCDGPLLQKRTATGYGGVVVQACSLNGETVTIVYGHLKIDRVTSKTGTEWKAGDRIGILGKAFSSETGGERKHLHLGIHRGSSIDIRGYVLDERDLNQWINAEKIDALYQS